MVLTMTGHRLRARAPGAAERVPQCCHQPCSARAPGRTVLLRSSMPQPRQSLRTSCRRRCPRLPDFSSALSRSSWPASRCPCTITSFAGSAAELLRRGSRIPPLLESTLSRGRCRLRTHSTQRNLRAAPLRLVTTRRAASAWTRSRVLSSRSERVGTSFTQSASPPGSHVMAHARVRSVGRLLSPLARCKTLSFVLTVKWMTEDLFRDQQYDF